LLFAGLGAAFGTLPDLDILLQDAGVARHRSVLSHSLLASTAFALLCYVLWLYYPAFVPQWTWAVAFAATFLHTTVDSLTFSGTQLLFPFTRKNFSGSVGYDNTAANVALIGFCLLALYFIMPEVFSISQEALGSLPAL